MSEAHADAGNALSEQERRLIQLLRELRCAELHIFVSDGKPVRVEEIKKSIKL